MTQSERDSDLVAQMARFPRQRVKPRTTLLALGLLIAFVVLPIVVLLWLSAPR